MQYNTSTFADENDSFQKIWPGTLLILSGLSSDKRETRKEAAAD
jgi:hypothetical protein